MVENSRAQIPICAWQRISDTQLELLISLIIRPRYRIHIMTLVFILGCIYALPEYTDKMKAEDPKHIPIF